MIIFLNEDRAYVSWVTHHRTGFVLDSTRKPTRTRIVLHRATCPEIKHCESKRTHWTTGRRMKACSLDAEELKRWALEQVGGQPVLCDQCCPDQLPEHVDHRCEPHLTRLGREILSFVLEVATIHMDEDDSFYRLDVATIARCLMKTPGQLNAALASLLQEELLTIDRHFAVGESLSPRCKICPTIRAIRTLPSCATMTDAEIETALARLAGE